MFLLLTGPGKRDTLFLRERAPKGSRPRGEGVGEGCFVHRGGKKALADATVSGQRQHEWAHEGIVLERPDRPPTTDIEVDLQLLTFIEQYASNPIRSEILQFLGAHPERCLSAQEVAEGIGRSHRLVRLELYELSLLQVVRAIGHNGQMCYRLSKDQTVRDLVARFAAALDG